MTISVVVRAAAAGRTTAAVALLATLVATPGCVERLIFDAQCGNGRFEAGEVCFVADSSREYIYPFDPLSLRVADFSGDGHIDLLVSGTDAVAVTSWLHWGDGDGGMSPPFPTGGTGCSAHPVPGDFDGVAPLDILFDGCGPEVLVYTAEPGGNGDLAPPLALGTGVETRSASFRDLDADGQREVAVLGTAPDGSAALVVIEREPAGQFSAWGSTLASPSEGQPSGISEVDFDRDGIVDLFAAAGLMSVASGRGDLTFDPLFPVYDEPVDGASVRDLDGDGEPEIIAFIFASERVATFTLGNDTLEPLGQTEIPGFAPGPAVAEDLDGDGRLDLLLAEPGEANLQAWLGAPQGRFEGPIEIELDAPVDQIAVGDFNEDGAPDLVAGIFGQGVVRVLLAEP